MENFNQINHFCSNCKDFSNIDMQYIASGVDGSVFDIGNQKVMKISVYNNELGRLSLSALSNILFDIKLGKYNIFPIVYDYMINFNNKDCYCESGYMIVLEKLFPCIEAEQISRIMHVINTDSIHSGMNYYFNRLSDKSKRFIENYIYSNVMMLDVHKDNIMQVDILPCLKAGDSLKGVLYPIRSGILTKSRSYH